MASSAYLDLQGSWNTFDSDTLFDGDTLKVVHEMTPLSLDEDDFEGFPVPIRKEKFFLNLVRSKKHCQQVTVSAVLSMRTNSEDQNRFRWDVYINYRKEDLRPIAEEFAEKAILHTRENLHKLTGLKGEVETMFWSSYEKLKAAYKPGDLD